TFSDLQAHSTTSIKRPPARQTQSEKFLAKSPAALFFNAITPGLSDSELLFSLFHLWESRNRELRIGFELQLFNKILEGLTVNYLRGSKRQGLEGLKESYDLALCAFVVSAKEFRLVIGPTKCLTSSKPCLLRAGMLLAQTSAHQRCTLRDIINSLNTVSTMDATVKLNCVSKGFSSQDTQFQFFIYHASLVMCLSQAVLNSNSAVYNRCAYLNLSNYFLAIYNSLDEDETLRELI
ncbi:hypothetical protein HID58_059731, partial [Brassica napus]